MSKDDSFNGEDYVTIDGGIIDSGNDYPSSNNDDCGSHHEEIRGNDLSFNNPTVVEAAYASRGSEAISAWLSREKKGNFFGKLFSQNVNISNRPEVIQQNELARQQEAQRVKEKKEVLEKQKAKNAPSAYELTPQYQEHQRKIAEAWSDMHKRLALEKDVIHPQEDRIEFAEQQLRIGQKKYFFVFLVLVIGTFFYRYKDTTEEPLDVKLIVDYYNKGARLLKKNKNKEALDFFNKALALDPKSKFMPLYFNKGVALDSLGKYKEAIDNYNIAIKLDNKYASAYLNKGVSLLKQNKNSEAIKNFDKAIELNPNNSYSYNNKGVALGNLKKYQEAIDNYNKAIELDPKNFEPYKNKFCPLYNLKRYEEAIEACDKAIELEPYPPDIQEVIANRLKSLNKLEEISKNNK